MFKIEHPTCTRLALYTTIQFGTGFKLPNLTHLVVRNVKWIELLQQWLDFLPKLQYLRFYVDDSNMRKFDLHHENLLTVELLGVGEKSIVFHKTHLPKLHSLLFKKNNAVLI